MASVVVFLVVVIALLVALVLSCSTMVSTSPTRRATGSSNNVSSRPA